MIVMTNVIKFPKKEVVSREPKVYVCEECGWDIFYFNEKNQLECEDCEAAIDVHEVIKED